MASQRPADYGDAADALIHLAHDLAGSPDYGGPLARMLAHLRHLPEDRLEGITEAAYRLSGLLQTGYDTHATTAGISFGVREMGGTKFLEGMREQGCAACTADLPNWREGVCRVCGEPAYDPGAYYCSEDHRLQDVQTSP